MSDDRDNLPALLQRASERLPERLRRRGSRLADDLVTSLAALSDQLAHRLTRPDNISRLQRLLAAMAELPMRIGFKQDPRAARLYDFVTWLEQRHDRQIVASVVMRRNLLRDGSLITLMRSVSPELIDPLLAQLEIVEGDLRSGPQLEPLEALARAQDTLLHLLCELAELEYDRAAPAPGTATDELVAYFEDAPLPTRYYDLAQLAAGDPFAYRDDGPAPKRPATPIAGASTALSRAADLANNPIARFVLSSYLFFFQAYTTQILIEALPDLIARLEPGRHDVVDLDRQ